jgi:hypothetical protein
MSNLDPDIQQQVARLAAAYYRQELSYEAFLRALPEIDPAREDAVTELLDVIEHEPARGRFLGLPPAKHDAYLADIQRRITELAAAGRARDQAI